MTSFASPPPIADLDGERAAPSRLDRLGIAASAACVLHCLATPFLLLLVPVMGAWWSHPTAHWGLAVLVLPLAVGVVFRGYRRHRRVSALVAVAVGVVLIVAGLVLPETGGSAPLSLTFPAPAAAEPNSIRSAAPTALHDEMGQSPGEAECADTCCPSFAYDVPAGRARLTLPPGSVATLVGSLFLVAAHAINLHGCRCPTRNT